MTTGNNRSFILSEAKDLDPKSLNHFKEDKPWQA